MAPTTASSTGSRPSPTHTVVATLAALGVAAGGILHLRIWDRDYRHLPSLVPGVKVVQAGFPIDFALSIALAVAVLAFAFGLLRGPVGRLAVLAAGALQVGALVALLLSREASLLGWKEHVWDTNAEQVLVTELVGLVLVVATLVLDVRRSTRPS